MRSWIALMGMILSAAGAAVAQSPSTGAVGNAPAPSAPAGQAKPAQPGVATPSASPEVEKADPAKDAAIRHLMEITETSKMGDRISNMITMQVRSVMSQQLPQERLEKFMESFSDKFFAGAPP